MVMGDEFQSSLSLTIQHTNGERLEGLRCCELPESVSTHSIWVRKVSLGQAKFVPTHDQKTGCGGHFRAHPPISTSSNQSLYLWWEIGRVKLIWNGWISLYTHNLGVKRIRTPSQNFHHHPSTQKLGCGDGCGGWIPISTMSNHSTY